MHVDFAHLKNALTLLLVLASGILSACGSSGGCTVVSSSGTISGTVTLGPHCADATTTATSGYSISGTVSGGSPLGTKVGLSGAGTASTSTDANGNYSLTGISNGIYTLTPSRAGYVFSPVNLGVTVNGGNASGNDFVQTASIGATTGISGSVAGAVAQNVTITLSGANNGSVLTDANGNFDFSGLAAGSYTLTPSLTGYVFSPVSSAVTTTSGGNALAGRFTASFYAAATTRLVGTVSGATAQNVVLILSGTNTGSAVTDANGRYGFSGLVAGSYTVTPSLAGYTFSPANVAVVAVGGETIVLASFSATH